MMVEILSEKWIKHGKQNKRNDIQYWKVSIKIVQNNLKGPCIFMITTRVFQHYSHSFSHFFLVSWLLAQLMYTNVFIY